MCRVIVRHREALKLALVAVADVDILRAKAKMGRDLKGVIPEVSVFFDLLWWL
jgi:dsDNA-specific endonuclease/ATPase MutS2